MRSILKYKAYILSSYAIGALGILFILFQIYRDNRKIKALNKASNKDLEI